MSDIGKRNIHSGKLFKINSNMIGTHVNEYNFTRIFYDSSEKHLGTLGIGYLQNYMISGKSERAILLLSNKRLYQRGKALQKSNRGWILVRTEKVVDIKDITGTSFLSNKRLSLLFSSIFFGFATLALFGISILNRKLEAEQNWDVLLFLLGSIMTGACIWAYLFLQKKVFIVEYAGGSIGVDSSAYAEIEITEFQKKISKLKDEYFEIITQERPNSINITNANAGYNKFSASNDLIYNDAFACYQSGDLTRALLFLDRGLAISPTNEDYLKLKSLIVLKTDELNNKNIANLHIIKSLENARALFQNYQYDEALAQIEKIPEWDKSPDCKFLHNEILNIKQKKDTAVILFEKASDLLKANKFAESIVIFKESLAIEHSSNCENKLAFAIDKRKEQLYSEAIEYYNQKDYNDAINAVEQHIHLGGMTDKKVFDLKSQIESELNKIKRKKNQIIILSFIVGILIIVAFFIFMKNRELDTEDWNQTILKNNKEGYNEYLRKHSSGIYSSCARDSISAIDTHDNFLWESNKPFNGTNGLEYYIQTYPQGLHSEEAKSMLDSMYWLRYVEADENNKDVALSNYLDNVPNGSHVGEAQSKLSVLKDQKLSSGELDKVKETISSFYHNLYQHYYDELSLQLAPILTSYFSSRNIAKGNVIESIKRSLENNKITSERNNIDWSSFKAKRTIDKKYIILFNMDYFARKEYPPTEDMYNVNVVVELDENYKMKMYNQNVLSKTMNIGNN